MNIYAIFVSIKHMLCNYKQFQENKLDFPFWDDERVMGSSYNTDEASLAGLQITSCCGDLVPNNHGLVLVLTHCAGIVDSCSKPNSETFCKANHPATSQFLNK